jgi:hypothetical protein
VQLNGAIFWLQYLFSQKATVLENNCLNLVSLIVFCSAKVFQSLLAGSLGGFSAGAARFARFRSEI